MKLIKLSSDTSGEFENIFNTDIKVKPFSKIGLLSASVPLSSEIINIDNSNDQFEMRTQQNHLPMYDVKIEEGNYTEPAFELELQRALNTALNHTVETSSTPQWKVQFLTPTSDTGRYLSLDFRRGKLDQDVIDTSLSVSNNLTFSEVDDTFTKSSIGSDWGAFGITNGFFTNGCGESSFTVDVAATTKFAFGLLAEPTAPGTTVLNPSDYDYCVYSIEGEANYFFQSKGEEAVDTGVVQVDGVNVYATLSLGKLIFYINISSTGAEHTLATITDWTYTTNYHLAFNIRTTGGVIDKLEWDPDPFFTYVDGVLLNHPPGNVYGGLLGQTQGIAEITFKSKARTGTYMGFHDPGYSMKAAGLSWNLVAEESLREAVSFTDLLIELPNLSMESYDGALSEQRPVIAYIPSLEVKNNELVYNAINPVMIDMNNAHAFNLNRVSVRLLTSSSNNVSIEAASIVVVLD